MIIEHQFLTLGKTDRRNDDMGLAVPIFRNQVLGIIGDFTSDSIQGAGEACITYLKGFIGKRLATWQEMRLPAKRLLPLLVHQINEWLRDYGKVQTTLIVLVWDLHTQSCHFISVGDSGLAVVGPNGVRYLREGDRGGLRVSAGFLPADIDPTVEVATVAENETIIAFTDGFWENTHTFMNDDLLQKVLAPPKLMGAVAAVEQHIMQPAIRKDDLSILIFKAEQTTPEGRGTVTSEEMARLVREELARQIDHAVGEGRLDAQPTPIEQDFARLLGDAPQLEQRLLDSLLPQMTQQISQDLKQELAYLSKTQEQHHQDLLKKIDAQNMKIKNLEQKVKKLGASTIAVSDRSNPTNPSERRQSNRRVHSTPSRSQASTDWVAKIKEAYQSPAVVGVTVLIGVVLVGLLIWNFMGGSSPVQASTQYSTLRTEAMDAQAAGDWGRAIKLLEQAASADPSSFDNKDRELLATWKAAQPYEDREPISMPDPKPVDSYQAAPISDAMLVALGTDRTTYERQTQKLQLALDELPELKSSSLEAVMLGEDIGRNENGLSVNLKPQTYDWVNQRPLPAGRVAAMWFQGMLDVTADGDPGEGTLNAFSKKSGERINAGNRMRAALTTGSLAELDEEIRRYAGNFSKKDYTANLKILAETLHTMGPGKQSLKVTLSQNNKTRAITAILKVNGKPTELGSWLEDVRTKPTITPNQYGRAIRVLWLAHHLRLTQSDGAASPAFILQIAPFAGKSASDIFNETVKPWKVGS